MMSSFNTNEQVHWTFDIWENHGGSVFMLEFQKDLSILS